MPDQLQKLQAMFEAHDKLTTGMASVKDVKQLFDMLLGVVKELKGQLEKQMSDKHEMSLNKCEVLASELSDVENRLKDTIQGIHESTNTSLKGLKGLINDEISKVIQLIPKVKDYTSEIGYLEDLIKTVEKKIPEIPKELSGEIIVDKINRLPTDPEYQIGKEHIKGLDEELSKIKATKSAGFVGGLTGGRTVQVYDLSASLNGVLKSFTLPAFWKIVSINSSSFPFVFRPTVDYTVSGTTLTFTDDVVAESMLATGQSLIVIFAE